MDDKEREELEELRTIVAIFDKAVRKMTKKYLKDAPRGRIPLESFFELLMAKARKIGQQKAFEDLLEKNIRFKLEFYAQSQVGGRIKELTYLPVLVRPAAGKKLTHPLDKYRAISLRGNVRRSVTAQTPEDAYAALRPDMLDHFSKTVADVTICKMDLMDEYDAGRYLKEDVVAGFRVIVKVSTVPVPKEEENDA